MGGVTGAGVVVPVEPDWRAETIALASVVTSAAGGAGFWLEPVVLMERSSSDQSTGGTSTREKGEAVLGELLSAWLAGWRGVRGFDTVCLCAGGTASTTESEAQLDLLQRGFTMQGVP